MLLSFDAKQKLKLSVTRNKEYLSKYLLEEERVVGAMLDSKKLVLEGVGRYKYTVTSFKVFQLDINPVVLIAVENKDGILKMSALESTLDGLGIIDDFNVADQDKFKKLNLKISYKNEGTQRINSLRRISKTG